MIRKTKHGFLKAAGFMLAVMMSAACVISGTLARFTSLGTVGGDSFSLQVATWDIEVTAAGDVDGEGNSITHQLADLAPASPPARPKDTAKITSLEWTIENTANTEDSGAVPANGTIAPGTRGYAEILTITNNSDVDVEITITGLGGFFPESSILEFGVFAVGTEYDDDPSVGFEDDSMTWLDSGGDLEFTFGIQKTGGYSDNTKKVYICYSWAIDANGDDDDTTMAGTSIDFQSPTLTITATQAQTSIE